MESSELLSKAEQAYENDDMNTAISIFTELANGNISLACQYLGLIFKTGDGVPKNIETSNMWYSKYVNILKLEVNKGNIDSILKLGKMYQYGDVVEINDKKALSLFEKAANIGCAEAQFHLAMIYLYGWCGEYKNLLFYNFWLNKAVDNEYPEALYLKGLDMLKNNSSKYDGIRLIEKSSLLDFWPATEYLSTLRNPINEAKPA